MIVVDIVGWFLVAYRIASFVAIAAFLFVGLPYLWLRKEKRAVAATPAGTAEIADDRRKGQLPPHVGGSVFRKDRRKQ